jgi:hypothetical protein
VAISELNKCDICLAETSFAPPPFPIPTSPVFCVPPDVDRGGTRKPACASVRVGERRVDTVSSPSPAAGQLAAVSAATAATAATTTAAAATAAAATAAAATTAAAAACLGKQKERKNFHQYGAAQFGITTEDCSSLAQGHINCLRPS